MSKNHTNKLQNLLREFSSLTPFIPVLTLTLTTALVVANLRTLPSSASDSVVSEISVTVQPSCTLTNESDLSSSSTIKTLQPGTYDPDIHTITLTSNCNDIYDSQIFAIGYSNDETGNTNLIGQTSKAIISGLTPFETNPNDFTTSGWYMKVSPNSTDTWQFTPENNFNTFHTIPSTSTLVAKTTITTNQITKPTSTLTTTYSAYASPSQAADTYGGKVKYTLMSTPSIPTKYYIQNFTLNDCKVNVGKNGNSENIGDNITVYDLRDENDYTVRYINGYCWMTQNLRFVGDAENSTMTLDSTTSNISSTYTKDNPLVISYYDPSNTSYCGLTNGYDYACLKNSNDTTIGAWYNFIATTAGTVTGYDNSEEATEDICPVNWHLPSGPFSARGTDGFAIFQNTTFGDYISANTSLTAFDAMHAGGFYYGGDLLATDTMSIFWSSTASDSTARYDLFYYSGVGFNSNGHGRHTSFFVRCVRTS